MDLQTLFKRGIGDVINYGLESHHKSKLLAGHTPWYQTSLVAHTGCINSLKFSNCEDYMATGGDDRTVLIWKVSEALSLHSVRSRPSYIKSSKKHLSNIFALDFTCDDSKVVSGGNDCIMRFFDSQSGQCIGEMLSEGDAIYSVHADPFNPQVFAAAGENGNIQIVDLRFTGSACLNFWVHDVAHGVKYNPAVQSQVHTMASHDNLTMWDLRFLQELEDGWTSDQGSDYFPHHDFKPALEYKLPGRKGKSGGMSLAINKAGTQIFGIFRKNLPLLYNIGNPTPIRQFSHDTYYNGCTLKSCAFAGPNDEYVVTGSDNYSVYMWNKGTDDSKTHDTTPHRMLRGHRSIVNHVEYNDKYNVLASCGVEKMVKLWSPVHLSDNLEAPSERALFDYETIQNMADNPQHQRDSTEEDTAILAFFDNLIQQDLNEDPDEGSNMLNPTPPSVAPNILDVPLEGSDLGDDTPEDDDDDDIPAVDDEVDYEENLPFNPNAHLIDQYVADGAAIISRIQHPTSHRQARQILAEIRSMSSHTRTAFLTALRTHAEVNPGFRDDHPEFVELLNSDLDEDLPSESNEEPISPSAGNRLFTRESVMEERRRMTMSRLIRQRNRRVEKRRQRAQLKLCRANRRSKSRKYESSSSSDDESPQRGKAVILLPGALCTPISVPDEKPILDLRTKSLQSPSTKNDHLKLRLRKLIEEEYQSRLSLSSPVSRSHIDARSSLPSTSSQQTASEAANNDSSLNYSSAQSRLSNPKPCIDTSEETAPPSSNSNYMFKKPVKKSRLRKRRHSSSESDSSSDGDN